MKKFPFILICTRLLLGALLVPLSYLQINHYPTIAVIFLTAGLLSDIFDGILASVLSRPTVTPGETCQKT
jgi:phosphatidylglycerophosphate synthase